MSGTYRAIPPARLSDLTAPWGLLTYRACLCLGSEAGTLAHTLGVTSQRASTR